MPAPRFIQIHSLASYPATLLNRDASGSAKRLPFGGAMRARISSQALKRRWRFAGEADHDAAAKVAHSLQSLGEPMGERSKEVVERVIMPRALEGLPPLHEVARQVISTALIVELYGDKAGDPKNRQALFFGHPEIEYVRTIARGLAEQAGTRSDLLQSAGKEPGKEAVKWLGETAKESLKQLRTNLRALSAQIRGAAGLESALFGRMVTSDPAANLDAPIHVAHAFTVHAIERELDYVTAVDDLRSRGADAESGSAGIFDIELTSGLYYGYVNVDVPLLVENLGGNALLAGRVVDKLLRLIAMTSPGAKKGSTAPYSRAEYLLVEAGDEQPRTLANSFRTPVAQRGNTFAAAMQALQEHLRNLDTAYGVQAERMQMSVTPPALTDIPAMPLNAICDRLVNRLGAV